MIPLSKQHYQKLIEPLKEVKFNNLFARFVVEGQVSGKVYVDNELNPETFYVVHPYGMSLLFGKFNNKSFNDCFYDYALNKNKIRNQIEWMQAFPNDWDNVLIKLFGKNLVRSSDSISGQIELNTRVNFAFNRDLYNQVRQSISSIPYTIERTNKESYNVMKGSVIPAKFWDCADDFLNKGVGFSLFHNGKLASTAYSAFIFDELLELGIETVEEFRGKGLARYACFALIDYCLENGYEPIWSCRLENIGSYNLAKKLGFEPTLQIPFYKISV